MKGVTQWFTVLFLVVSLVPVPYGHSQEQEALSLEEKLTICKSLYQQAEAEVLSMSNALTSLTNSYSQAISDLEQQLNEQENILKIHNETRQKYLADNKNENESLVHSTKELLATHEQELQSATMTTWIIGIVGAIATVATGFIVWEIQK